METFARFGYAAKGFVYGAIGILAILAAFNVSGGQTTDTTGALSAIATKPFGRILLILIAIGLVGYVIWRFIEAIKDPDRKGNDPQGLFTRLGYILSGLAYIGVAINAALLGIGSSSNSGGGSNSQQDWTATVMQQPLGRWLVGIAGAIVIGIGVWRLYEAYKIKFRKQLNLNQLNPSQQNWLVNISRFGIAARGVVFIALGFFILQAAHQYNPQKVQGLDGVLLSFAQQPFGKIFLTLVAAGLVAYAVYLILQARFRRFKIS
jgi:multisubunit Na+/H+ antiporter MnhC subunit